MIELDSYRILDSTEGEIKARTSERRNYYGMKGSIAISLLGIGSFQPIPQSVSPKYELIFQSNKSNISESGFKYYDCLRKYNTYSTSKKDDLIKSIVGFKSLIDCWDGFNAVPVGIYSASNSIKLLNSLDLLSINRITDIYPNPHGTVSFEWENNTNEIISVEVGKDTMSYFVSYNSTPPVFFNKVPINIENIETLKAYIKTI
ncbi:MAG: hypothetical protein KL787_08865 [Taibaiella sp.]|nr:hypothetical protein [Taibaiella sp.]